MKAKVYNFPEMMRGDTFLPNAFTIEENSTPKNLTGAAIRIQFRRQNNTIQKEISVSNGITFIDASLGQFQIDAFSTEDWLSGTYLYDCEITLAGVKQTYFGGTLTLFEDVTK